MAYIELKHIVKSFEEQAVLRNVDISIAEGEFITLLGPSGCGKTTLLRALAGLEAVDEGQVFLDGEDITHKEVRKRNIGMIFQQYALFPTMTVYKNVAFGLQMQKVDKKAQKKRVMEALEIVDMAKNCDKFPSQLSGGEQQRAALARSIVTNNKVLLLDEPFSAIDAKLRKALQIKIRDIHNTYGMTTIFVTHDQEEAMRISDRIYLMNNGRVEQEGTPMELYLQPKTPFVASFIGSYNIWETKDGCQAVRPESIGISHEPQEEKDGFFYLQGMIVQKIPQGTIIRYTVLVGERKLDVDVLSDGTDDYKVGDVVCLSIEDAKIMKYQKRA